MEGLIPLLIVSISIFVSISVSAFALVAGRRSGS